MGKLSILNLRTITWLADFCCSSFMKPKFSHTFLVAAAWLINILHQRTLILHVNCIYNIFWICSIGKQFCWNKNFCNWMLLLHMIVSVRLHLCLNVSNEDRFLPYIFINYNMFMFFKLLPICDKYVTFKAQNQNSIYDDHYQYQLHVLSEAQNKYFYSFWT